MKLLIIFSLVLISTCIHAQDSMLPSGYFGSLFSPKSTKNRQWELDKNGDTLVLVTEYLPCPNPPSDGVSSCLVNHMRSVWKPLHNVGTKAMPVDRSDQSAIILTRKEYDELLARIKALEAKNKQ